MTGSVCVRLSNNYFEEEHSLSDNFKMGAKSNTLSNVRRKKTTNKKAGGINSQSMIFSKKYFILNLVSVL